MPRTARSHAELLPPELPESPEFEAAGWYRAGMQGQEAGGDFYDVFKERSAAIDFPHRG